MFISFFLASRSWSKEKSLSQTGAKSLKKGRQILPVHLRSPLQPATIQRSFIGSPIDQTTSENCSHRRIKSQQQFHLGEWSPSSLMLQLPGWGSSPECAGAMGDFGGCYGCAVQRAQKNVQGSDPAVTLSLQSLDESSGMCNRWCVS